VSARVLLRWTLGAAAVAFGVLLVTGLYLIWNYRPYGDIPWTPPSGVRIDMLPHRMNLVHEWAARIFGASVIASTIVAIAVATETRRWGPVITGVGLVLVTIVAALSGNILPWDQVALTAVTVGTDMAGYDQFSDDTVRYVLIGGYEIDGGTFMAWFRMHTIAIPIVLVALGVTLVLLTRQRPAT
jgi:quinol-cytochrome oxidoreductase complex cytochrome b subunit